MAAMDVRRTFAHIAHHQAGVGLRDSTNTRSPLPSYAWSVIDTKDCGMSQKLAVIITGCVSLLASSSALGQTHQEHTPAAPTAQSSSQPTCPNGMSMGAGGQNMSQHMAQMQNMMQQMHTEMQEMHKEMMQMHRQMQTRR